MQMQHRVMSGIANIVSSTVQYKEKSMLAISSDCFSSRSNLPQSHLMYLEMFTRKLGSDQAASSIVRVKSKRSSKRLVAMQKQYARPTEKLKLTIESAKGEDPS